MDWLLDNNSKFLNHRGFISCLVDNALHYGIQEHQLLQGSGIFYEGLSKPETHYCVDQIIRIVQNIENKVPLKNNIAIDTGSNLYNQLSIPLDLVSKNSQNLSQAIGHILDFQRQISPFFSLSEFSDGDYYFLFLNARSGLDNTENFLAIVYLKCILSLIKLNSPDTQCFIHLKGGEHEYDLSLFEDLCPDLSFSSPFYVISLEQSQLKASNTQRSPLAYERYLQDSLRISQKHVLPQYFTQVVFELVLKSMHQEQKLDFYADIMQMSPASFKRRLKKNGVNFQKLLDEARMLISLKLLYIDQLPNDEIAYQLNFSDSKNFRRYFKRCTGMLPSEFKASALP